MGGGGNRKGRKRKPGHREPSGKLSRAAKRAAKPKPDEQLRTARRLPHRRGLKSSERLSQHAESVLGRLLLTGHLTDKGVKDEKPEQAEARYERAQARYVAGERYARVVGRYRSVIETPRLNAPLLGRLSASGTESAQEPTADVARGFTCWVEETGNPEACDLLDSEDSQQGYCACLRRKEAYDAAHAAVLGVPLWPPMVVAEPDKLTLAIACAGAARVQHLPKQDVRAARAVARVAVQGQEPGADEIVHLQRGLSALARHFGLTGRPRGSSVRNSR